jgi:hypothetical protein
LRVVLPSTSPGITVTNTSYSINGGATWLALTVTNGQAVIKGLKTKTAYSIQVRTLDSLGTNGASSPVLKVTTK